MRKRKLSLQITEWVLGQLCTLKDKLSLHGLILTKEHHWDLFQGPHQITHREKRDYNFPGGKIYTRVCYVRNFWRIKSSYLFVQTKIEIVLPGPFLLISTPVVFLSRCSWYLSTSFLHKPRETIIFLSISLLPFTFSPLSTLLPF